MERAAAPSGEEITDTFVPKHSYLSREFLELESARLWPRVWQVACREEEIPSRGDYVTYDVADESVIVVRTGSDAIKAYHNVCQHRGRPLTAGAGHAGRFVCPFHGWQWSLDGENVRVVDQKDWKGCLNLDDIKLQPVLAEVWGGFVFVNMDLDAEPLSSFLHPLADLCDKFEFEKLRYRWYKTVVLPCNWKVALEAFNEAYHVQQTHPQILKYFEDYSESGEYGRHGAFWYPELPEGRLPMQRSSRLAKADGSDYRRFVLDFVEEMHTELGAMVTPRAYEATQRLRDEVAADASQLEVVSKWTQFQIEAAQNDGAGWPELTPEYIIASRVDWHMFPNSVYLHSSVDGVLWYRARPNGKDPDSCIFDIWSLVRYAAGDEPPLEREFYADWTAHDFRRILNQDLSNLTVIQRGMKSRGFKGARLNPVQERAIYNFNRALHEFLHEEDRES